jgi:selenocysteine-specific elongation factor
MNAKIRLIGSKKIYPFNNSIVELILENPIALVSGDRFILRSLSPSLTVAGGTILSCHKIKERGSKKEVLIERLNKSAKFAYENDFFVAELFACPNPLISKNELVRMTGLLGEDANKLISRKISIGILAEINDSLFVVLGRINELCDKIKKPLEKYHKDNPNSLGMEFNSMLKLVGLESANTAKLWKLLETLSADFKIVNNRIAMKNFRPTSSSRTLELKERIISILKDAGINCPAIGNIISALSISETEMKGLIKMLVEEKHAVVIGNHITSYAVYELCLLKVTELYKAKKNIEIADFRAETGAARNMAVAILEKFDSLGFTKRTPSGRIFIKKFEG